MIEPVASPASRLPYEGSTQYSLNSPCIIIVKADLLMRSDAHRSNSLVCLLLQRILQSAGHCEALCLTKRATASVVVLSMSLTISFSLLHAADLLLVVFDLTVPFCNRISAAL